MATDIKIRRLDDNSLYRAFASARDAGQAALDRAEGLHGTSHQVVLDFNSNFPWKISEDELSSAPPGQFTVTNARVLFRLSVDDKRPNQKRNESVSFSLVRAGGDHLVDTFRIDTSSPATSINQPAETTVVKAIYTALSPLLQPVAPEDGGLVTTLSNLSEAFSATYQGIAKELSSAVAAVNDERAKQLSEFEDERRRLREEMVKERSESADLAKKELEIARAELAREREEIDAAAAKLEISSHKDARRKQFTALQESLRDALGKPIVDSRLNKNRWAVFWAFFAAGVTAAVLAILTLSYQTTGNTSTAAWLLPAVKTGLLSLTSIGAFFSAAAWLRYFYIRDMQFQEEMRRFRNDMARASWVMDAAMEIRKEHDEEIPPEWIAGVTEGLFSARKKDTLEEGAQALAALMGLSASATIGPNGPSFELNKSGKKKIAAAAKE